MRPHPVELFLRTTIGRAYLRVAGQLREPSWVIFDLVTPLLTTVGLVYFFRSLQAPEAFVGFVALGGAMATYWLNVLWNVASQLFWDREGSNLGLFLLAPASRSAVLLAMALGGLMSTTLKAAVIVAVASAAFGVRFQLEQPLLLATMAGVYAVGMLFAPLYLFFTCEAWRLNQLFEESIHLRSGFHSPVRHLGLGVAAASSSLPLILGLDAMRPLLFDPARAGGLVSVEQELLAHFGLFALFLLLAHVALERMGTLGKRQGRLTLRG